MMMQLLTKAEHVALLEAGRRQIGQGAGLSRIMRLPLGCADIDANLNGGLVAGALHEVTAADHRAIPAAWGFLLALARIAGAARGGGSIVWPVGKRPGDFGVAYGPGLKHFGLDPACILFIRCKTREDMLWVMEEALRIGGIGAVVGERVAPMDLTASRRLQLAAEASTTPIFLLRTHRDDVASAAFTRWRIAPHSASRDRFGFFAAHRWHVTLERVRGGRTGEWVVEWNHDALRLCIPAGLGSGALPAARARCAA